MENKKIIAVVGATGAQGGGLIRAILNDRESGFCQEQLPEMQIQKRQKN